LVLLAFCKTGYGQQTVLVTKNKENYYEEYSVLQSDKKIKHGRYLKLGKPLFGGYSFESVGSYTHGLKTGFWETYYENNNNIKEQGFYKNDQRDSVWVSFYPEGIQRKIAEVQSEEGTSLQVVDANPITSKMGNYRDGEISGIWEYFDQRGVIIQKYNHDHDSLVFSNNADTKNIDAGYIGGEFQLYQHLYDIFDFDGLMTTINTKISLQSSKIVFKFTVDETGKLRDITELENTVSNKKIYDRAFESTQSLNAKWYPTMQNGIPQTITKTITFKLDVSSSGESFDTGKWFFAKTTKGFNLGIKVE